MIWRPAVLFALTVAGCNFSFNPDVAEEEPSAETAGSNVKPPLEAGPTFDPAPWPDAAPSGPPDAALPNAALPDAALPDAALPDAALPDPAPAQARDAGGPCDGGCLHAGCQPCDSDGCTSSEACVPLCLPCLSPDSSS